MHSAFSDLGHQIITILKCNLQNGQGIFFFYLLWQVKSWKNLRTPDHDGLDDKSQTHLLACYHGSLDDTASLNDFSRIIQATYTLSWWSGWYSQSQLLQSYHLSHLHTTTMVWMTEPVSLLNCRIVKMHFLPVHNRWSTMTLSTEKWPTKQYM